MSRQARCSRSNSNSEQKGLSRPIEVSMEELLTEMISERFHMNRRLSGHDFARPRMGVLKS
jgi:hypothetical protein